MAPMPVPSPLPGPPMVLPHGVQASGSVHGSVHNNNQMLDFLESQVRGMDMGAKLLQPRTQYVGTHLQTLPPQQAALQPQPIQALAQAVPFSPGPPSMLSALDEIGVRGVERRVIQLPPIVGRALSLTSRRGSRENRAVTRLSSQSSGSSNRTGHNRNSSRHPGSSRCGILRGYSEESDWNDRQSSQGSQEYREDRGTHRSQPRVRSKAELIKELERATFHQDRGWSPAPQGGFRSSEQEDNGHRGVLGSRDRAWPVNPPSYSSIEIHPGHSKRTSEHNSVRISG